jgi:hypothetical protein
VCDGCVGDAAVELFAVDWRWKARRADAATLAEDWFLSFFCVRKIDPAWIDKLNASFPCKNRGKSGGK